MVALIATAIEWTCWRLFDILVAYHTNVVTFRVVVPVTVLIINAIVVREVRRRASNNAAGNLGIQHHQSTSSSSSTSSINFVQLVRAYRHAGHHFTPLCSPQCHVVHRLPGDVRAENLPLVFVSFPVHHHVMYLYRFVYVYNFLVYLITCKQFRSELLKLLCACCRRRSSSSSSPAAAAAANVRVARRRQADTAV